MHDIMCGLINVQGIVFLIWINNTHIQINFHRRFVEKRCLMLQS